jgi:putative transposase
MRKKQKRDREHAIRSYLNGESIKAIATKLGYSRTWVYKWIERYDAGGDDWQEDKARCPHSNPRKLPDVVVEAVKFARANLFEQGLFCGAQAIRWELETMQCVPLPSLRTINRIIGRDGLTIRRTGRYEPKGKAYPELIGRQANDVHQSDHVGPCYVDGPLRFYSLNSVDLVTGRCAVTPLFDKVAQSVIDAIWSNWWRLGIPKHQQIDNELVFYGGYRYPRGMGCMIRLCLSMNVEPWFIPLGEPWRNGVVEKFNDHYRRGFLKRIFIHGADDCVESLCSLKRNITRDIATASYADERRKWRWGVRRSGCRIRLLRQGILCPSRKRVVIIWFVSFAAMRRSISSERSSRCRRKLFMST